MKSKNDQSYLFKQRIKFSRKALIFFILYIVYFLILIRFFSYSEVLISIILVAPLLFLGITFWDLFDLLSNYQKGISGERKVRDILKKHNFRFEPNVMIEGVRSDYDFVVFNDEKMLVLEVKNHKYLDAESLKKITNNLAYKCSLMQAYLTHNRPGKYNWVEGIVVSVNSNFEVGSYKKKVITLGELENYLSNYFK